jgi:hypothetical protein
MDGALKMSEEAVSIYRFLPDLANSLNTLSLCLSDFGRSEDALKMIEEARYEFSVHAHVMS